MLARIQRRDAQVTHPPRARSGRGLANVRALVGGRVHREDIPDAVQFRAGFSVGRVGEQVEPRHPIIDADRHCRSLLAVLIDSYPVKSVNKAPEKNPAGVTFRNVQPGSCPGVELGALQDHIGIPEPDHRGAGIEFVTTRRSRVLAR
jgi:hypothetical protein